MVGAVSNVNAISDVYGVMSIMNVNRANNVSKINPLFEYSPSEQSVKLIDSFRENNNRMNELARETTGFLNEYSIKLNAVNTAAEKLAVGDEGVGLAQQPVEDAVSAVANLIDTYNEGVSLLNENASRGSEVEEQLDAVGQDAQLRDDLQQVGISLEEDGTLKLDEEKLTSVLQSGDESRVLFAQSRIQGEDGLAAGIAESAKQALKTPSYGLVANDLKNIQVSQSYDPVRDFAQSLRTGASGAANHAASGLLMNMAV